VIDRLRAGNHVGFFVLAKTDLETMQKQLQIILCMAGMAGLCLAGGRAIGQDIPQYPQYVQYPQGAPPVTPGAQVTLSPDQIDQLLAPIALYPDPLLSLIFPAATYPQDVVAAGQWLAATANPTEADIDAQSWDASIKGLAHYPTVLQMMSNQAAWTQTLGAAFLNQQQDVLKSVQRLRAEAQAAQNLQTSQQEQVVDDDGSILIEPVDPSMMYVPQYDSDLAYSSACQVSFGVGYPIGLWCDDDFDWGGDYVVVGGGWYQGWHHPAAWDQHPPAWDHHPQGWVASPRPWARASQSPAPRISSAAVSQLSLNRPRGAAAANSGFSAIGKSPAPLPIGREPAAQPLNNAFDSSQSRDDVQRAVQRARPAPAQAAPRAAQIRPAPRQAVAAPTPRQQAPEAAQNAPNNAFDGGSAGDTRAQSDRGHASAHR
jgi:hypothetical protein